MYISIRFWRESYNPFARGSCLAGNSTSFSYKSQFAATIWSVHLLHQKNNGTACQWYQYGTKVDSGQRSWHSFQFLTPERLKIPALAWDLSNFEARLSSRPEHIHHGVKSSLKKRRQLCFPRTHSPYNTTIKHERLSKIFVNDPKNQLIPGFFSVQWYG